TAPDNVDGDLTDKLVVSGSVDTSIDGSYTLTYSVTDSDGNESTAERTVTVSDLTPPVVTLLGDAAIVIGLQNTFFDAGATAVDNLEGDITASITIDNQVDVFIPGNYTVTYSAIDKAGNVGVAERQVEVKPSEGGGEIIWVADGGDASSDGEYINYLKDLGYSVQTPNLNEGSNRVNSNLQMLKDAALIIFAPNTRGDRFNNDAGTWNSLETPTLVIQHVATQSTGLGWFNERNYSAYSNDIEIKQANHPFFKGLNLSNGDLLRFHSGGTPYAVRTSNIGNGSMLAQGVNNPRPAMAVIWQKGIPFYNGGMTPAGTRAALGFPWRGRFSQLNSNGQTIFTNAVRMLSVIPDTGKPVITLLGDSTITISQG
ncbi:MAG: DUF5011 domain-containing protein, partial [Opitutae bacterium]